MAKPKGLWVWLLPSAKQMAQHLSDNVSENQQCFMVCTDPPSTKNMWSLICFCLQDFMQNVSCSSC